MRIISRLITLAVFVLLIYNLREITLLRKEVKNLKSEIGGVHLIERGTKKKDSIISKANEHAAKAKEHADKALNYSMKGNFEKAREEFDLAKTELDISIELAKSAGSDTISPAGDSIKKLEDTMQDASTKIKGLLDNLDSKKQKDK